MSLWAGRSKRMGMRRRARIAEDRVIGEGCGPGVLPIIANYCIEHRITCRDHIDCAVYYVVWYPVKSTNAAGGPG